LRAGGVEPHMEFPDAATVAAVFDPVDLPEFARVRYEPEAESIADPAAATADALADLAPDLPDGGKVAVGVGSRGVHDIATVAAAAVDWLADRGSEPVVVPAMGSHGGATAEGQRRALAGIGVDEASVDCPIDARMGTAVVGEPTVGDTAFEVNVATAALEADAVLPINRVKPHTNFGGEIESGVNKMLAVGFGKQPGARAFHDTALREGYVPTIRAAVETIREAVPVAGGIAIVENFYDHTAAIEPLPADDLLDREPALLARAEELMPTLPFDRLDLLILDEIGKDISGTGMDTNVVGRYRVLNADDPAAPAIDRIYVRALTDATHGNGNGVGLADLVHADVAADLDLDQVYTNALTSGSLRRAKLPVVMPTDELAVTAALSTVGALDPREARIVHAANSSELSRFRVSAALVDDLPAAATVEGRDRVEFVDGALDYVPV